MLRLLVGLLLLAACQTEPVWNVGEKAMQWDRARIPLKVRVETPSLLELYGDTYRTAVRGFNEQVGCELFRFYDGPPDVVVLADSSNPTEAASTWRTTAGAEIRITNPGDEREALLALQHELGHVVGLAHDTFGLMVVNVTDFEGPGLLPALTEKDRAALRERYCR